MATAVATYKYSVRDRSGRLISGTLDGESSAIVASRLKQMGYAPVSIEQANTGLKKEITIPGFGNKVKLKDIAVMSRQFATMISSGLSLLRALVILSQQTSNTTLATALAQVRNDVETGNALSTSLAKHPKIFPALMINMVKAGEVGGFLDKALLQVAENFEAEVKLRGKIKSAMTYPVVVFVIAIIALVGMLLFVVPVFARIFKDLGTKLPAPTAFLVSLSDAMKFIAPIGLVMVIAFFFTWPRIKHKPEVRNFLDPLKFRLPVFGSLFKRIALARFARNLGTMLQSGVPILQSLEIVGETTGNVILERAIRDVQESVRQGESLTGPLASHPVFPPMVVQMLAVGEDTGSIDTMLHKVSEFYDQEVEATTESLTALIEPLMIVFVGSVIGAMIVALYMPIFSVMNAIKN